MAKYATNVSGAILLPSSIQVTESISGSVVPLAMFFCIFQSYDLSMKRNQAILFENIVSNPSWEILNIRVSERLGKMFSA